MPSSKSAGKRPNRQGLAKVVQSPVSSKTKADPPVKRILPSRSRRGGPGVGSCDIDDMIMDARQRAVENKPILPIHAVFMLTTDSSTVPPESSSASSDFGAQAYASYFDKPDVQRSFRTQSIIQTPDFCLLSEAAAVGGRLRVRNEEEIVDTSDAAYERRHRKYETFEKRQRRREKEKLIHEHHKLKERIEQLRAMDSPAFGGSTLAEQEETRQAMLEQAEELDRRYALLLPPEPKKGLSRKLTEDGEGEDDNHLSVSTPVAVEQPPIKLRLKIHPRVSYHPLPESPTPTPSPSSSSPRRSRRDSTARYAAETSTASLSPTSSTRPRKRSRVESRTRMRAPTMPDIAKSILYQTASRTEPNAKRKTARNVLAFGIKIPKDVEETRDFELPWWITRGVATGQVDGVESDDPFGTTEVDIQNLSEDVGEEEGI